MRIKNLSKAAKRIKKAVKNNEKIILYGDADIDGSASVMILEETIKILGGNIFEVYFPDREKEGYGLNFKALDYLKERAQEKALLIIMDSGISNFEEAVYAHKLGIELMIVDHHQPLDKLPKASIIVNPKQKGDKYPFKEFSNTGLVFKLSEEILGDKMTDTTKDSFLELVALGTMYDMMPQKKDNLLMTKKGLESLLKTERIGLKAFWNFPIFNKETPVNEIAQKMISILSAGGIVDHKTETYLVFSCKSDGEVQKILKELILKNKQKSEGIERIYSEVKDLLSGEEKIIFLGKKEWEFSFLGIVSSKICQETKKLVLLFKEGENESRGTVRAPSGINSVSLMGKCSNLLKTFGGHPAASGFLVENKNIQKFKKCLLKNIEK